VNKPRYYVATNRDNHLEFHAPATLAECVEEVAAGAAAMRAWAELDSDANPTVRGPGCTFVLVARGSTLEFLHADRFLDGVAMGDITETTSAQRALALG
jgi:hypothetical protein